MTKNPVDMAWGIEFGGSAVRLIRVSRTASGYHADRYAEAPLDERWETLPTPAEAAAMLNVGPIDGPLVACVPDELVLYRGLSLPAAEPAALARMAESQLESLVPAHAEGFATDWTHQADPHRAGHQRVLLCAARRDALAQCVDACRQLGAAPAGATPAALATALAWGSLCTGNDEPVVLLDVGARCTSLIVMYSRRPICCGVIDQGGDHWIEKVAEELGISPAEAGKITGGTDAAGRALDAAGREAMRRAVGGWARHVREVYDHCVEDIPVAHRPKPCILLGHPAPAASLRSVVAGVLEMDVLEGDQPERLTLEEGVDFDRAATAIGAAMGHMSANGSMVDLVVRPAARKARPARRGRWRWAAMGAWAVAIVLALYGLDYARGNRLAELAEQTRAKLDRSGGLERELALGRRLEASGPGPLEVMDRIAALVPANTILTTLRYSRSGEVTIGGRAASMKDCHLLLTRLGELGQAEPKGARKVSDKYVFDIELKLSHTLKPAPAEPDKKGDKGPDKSPAKGGAKPAGPGPAGAKGGRR